MKGGKKNEKEKEKEPSMSNGQRSGATSAYKIPRVKRDASRVELGKMAFVSKGAEAKVKKKGMGGISPQANQRESNVCFTPKKERAQTEEK